MKKIFTLFVLAAAMLTANAQYVGNKFFDNWSVGVLGGAVAPTTHHAVVRDARAVAGIELNKELTPYIGVGVQGVAGVNTLGIHQKGADEFVDNINATIYGKVNFSNLFFGYKGARRFFEVEGIAGVGINHYFDVKGANQFAVAEGNTFTSKLGLNINFNLGKDKQWTVALKPAIVYDLEGGVKRTDAQYNINNSELELAAGVAYHFKGSNGHSYFTKVKAYDQAEVDGLNAKINDLRAAVNGKDSELANKDAKIRDLQNQLNEARKVKPVKQETKTNTVTVVNNGMEIMVHFGQGKTAVDAAQKPNVARVATYLKNHKDAKVTIKGYASPEGSKEINEKIAKQRAEAVKTMLVKTYGIKASRIVAEGQGVGSMFSENDWNRVSICTLSEK
ncbi:MAG: OmpA family protein [Alloprevotella sp.]